MTNKQLQQFEREKSAAWNRYFEASRALKPWQFQERAALDAAYQQEHAAIVAKWESMGERPRISSASELALRAENERLDRIAMDYYKRLIGEAQEEIERLQSGIAALRADLINRRAVLVHRFRSVDAHQGAYMLPEMAVIEDVLRALGALVPEEEEEQ